MMMRNIMLLAAVFAAVASCAVIVMGLLFSPPAWFIIRVVIGYCMAGLFMVLESWFNSQATSSGSGSVPRERNSLIASRTAR